jgi:Flp pilus assembly protein TadB
MAPPAGVVAVGPIYRPGFAWATAGIEPLVIGLALALVVVGLIFLFLIPWVGIPVGIVGVILLVVWLLGFGKRAASEPQP